MSVPGMEEMPRTLVLLHAARPALVSQYAQALVRGLLHSVLPLMLKRDLLPALHPGVPSFLCCPTPGLLQKQQQCFPCHPSPAT